MHRKIAPLLAAVLGAGLLTAAAPAAPAERAAAPKTIVGVAAADKRFTTLVALVKQAGLAKTLSAKGSFTVFAPTNAAFAKLKQAAPETYAAVTSDKALLRAGAHLPRAREEGCRAALPWPTAKRGRR